MFVVCVQCIGCVEGGKQRERALFGLSWAACRESSCDTPVGKTNVSSVVAVEEAVC